MTRDARPPHPGILGRREERTLLRGLLNGARGGQSGLAVLRGEVGIGKSSLLDELAISATDFRICRALGIESEMELPYAGAQQFCAPLMAQLPNLRDGHRTTLEKVFGLATGSPPGRLLVGMAVHHLVATVAEERPLLCLVDDWQWLDEPSRQAIGFVARRLAAEQIVMVIAARDFTDDPDLAGLPEVRLSGLDDDDAGKLFDSVVVGPTDPPVRDRIIAETHGNPLAILELPRTWTTAELVEGLSEPIHVPVACELELAVAKKLSTLPPDTRTLLALAAAEPKGDSAQLWAAAQRLGIHWCAAAPAEDAGLIEFGPRVHFRYPHVRAIAYRAASLQKRMEVHRALAEVTDPVHDADRRAWHNACSTLAHDEDIALELERSADRAQSRGGFTAASALLERAAFLSADSERQANRALAAAQAKRDAGALGSALRLLSIVDAGPASTLRQAISERLRGRIALDQRLGAQAAEIFLGAAQRAESSAPGLARDIYLEAVTAAVWATGQGVGELLLKIAEAARVAPPSELPPTTSDLLLDAFTCMVAEGYAAAAPIVTTALAAVRRPDAEFDDPSGTMRLVTDRASVVLATEAWDYETSRAIAERQVERARVSGALVQLQYALNSLAFYVWQTGDSHGTATLVEEDRMLSTITGVTATGGGRLLVEVLRADPKTGRRTLDAFADSAINNDDDRASLTASYIAAVLYNGLGRHADALLCARRVMETGAIGYQTVAAAELAEAASREDNPELVAETYAWVQARATATPTPWALGIAARVQALCADSDTDALYRKSIEHLSQTPLRFDLARSQLLYGEWLRRSGQRGDARKQIALAHGVFHEMGAVAFADRARRELSATTARRARRNIDAPSTKLTSQETQIAQLAQQGLSNPEIGSRLFLSSRTVEWHLRNIFGKVGVSSRRDLRDKHLDLYRAD